MKRIFFFIAVCIAGLAFGWVIGKADTGTFVRSPDGNTIVLTPYTSPTPTPPPGPTPSPTPTPIPVSSPAPSGATQILPGQHISSSINPSPAANSYYFTLPKSSGQVIVYEGTGDWSTIQDIYVSPGGLPVCSGKQPVSPVFSNPNGTNNQTVYIGGTYPAGATFYITVCNRSPVQGKYQVYWSAN